MRITSDLKIFYPGQKAPVVLHRAELFPVDEIKTALVRLPVSMKRMSASI
jgi:hypothetical protein